MEAVSEEHPLADCRHFVACRPTDVPLHVGDEVLMFEVYGRFGVVVLDTVCDGDCGPDAGCMMLGLARTLPNRTALRREVSAY